MKRYLFIALFVCTLIAVKAQTEQTDIITDRPDVTESSICVPHKTLQIETGVAYEFDDTKSEKVKTNTYNSTLLRYGIIEGFELRFGFEYTRIDFENKTDQTKYRQKGMSPIFIGIKADICEQNGLRPEMALLSHLTMPRTGAEDFQSDYLTTDAILSIGWELNSRASLGANIGANWGDYSDKPKPTGYYSVALGIGLTDKAGFYVEHVGNFARDEDLISSLDGGFTFLVSPTFQFDIFGGFGINDIAPDYFVGAGLSFRVPK